MSTDTNHLSSYLDIAPEGWPEGRRLPTGLSASSLQTFESCERRFAFEKIERLPSPPNTAAAAGTHVHQVLQHVMQLPPHLRTLQSALSRHHRTMRRVDALAEELAAADDRDAMYATVEDSSLLHLVHDYYESGAERKIFIEKALEGIYGYFSMPEVDPKRVDVLACERSIKATIETPDGEVPVRGEIDRVDLVPGGVRIVDYKNGKFPKPFRGDDGQGKFRDQVGIYALMWEEVEGERPVSGALVFTAKKRLVRITVDDELLDGVREKLGSAWRAVHEKTPAFAFEPKVGPLCAWCPFVDRCPDGRAEVERRAEKGTKPGGVRADAPARAILGIPA